MTTAFLFPGQGVSNETAGRVWYESSRDVHDLVDRAAAAAETTPERLLAVRPGALLPTEFLEPLHTALCLGIHRELDRRGVRPDIVAGHSLGEISACAAAGLCSPEEAVALAAERGLLMAREAARRPGGMLTFRNATHETVAEAVAFARSHGAAAVAAHNAPDQWVVSGEWGALRRMAARYPAQPLQVAGAWHSDVLAGAVDEFRDACRRRLRGAPRVPLVSNRTGRLVGAQEDLCDLLAGQFTHPVEWSHTMRTLVDFGVAAFVTVGPGRVLQGLVRLNLGGTGTIHGTDTAAELVRTVEALSR